jgi:hypothetical protein
MMFTIAKPQRAWSEFGIRALIGSVIASVLLAFADGILRGVLVARMSESHGLWEMFAVWAQDFRYLADQAIYASTIFIVGAKFIETRTILTVGFDKLDAEKVALKGPDENNTVWIGQRYGTQYEAEVIAEAIAERLRVSAA